MEASLTWIKKRWKKGAALLAVCLLGYWLLRSCVPGLSGDLLPADVFDSIRRQYSVCITDTPISPGEPRQPACGDVTIVEAGRGTIPSERRAEGIAQAVCYKVTYTTPHWTTLGTTRHEIDWSGRIASKVAVLQNGEWKTYPDREDQDEPRWAEFGCPAGYESKSLPSGG